MNDLTMKNFPARANFFDASALAHVFSRPRDNLTQKIKPYFDQSATKYTTPFCFYEAMSVLKSNWKYKKKITLDSYLESARKLTKWYGTSSKIIKDLDFTDSMVFSNASEIAARYSLDLSDAYQIVSVQHGSFSRFVDESATVLITADKELAKAARQEGLRVWDACSEDPP